jgi:hypothetical protein
MPGGESEIVYAWTGPQQRQREQELQVQAMTKKPASSRRLTFAQREAGAAIPQQMQREEVSRALRVKLFDLLLMYLNAAQSYDSSQGAVVTGWLNTVLEAAHTDLYEQMPDEYKRSMRHHTAHLKSLCKSGTFAEIYGFLEFVLRHPQCRSYVAGHLSHLLEETQAAFRIVDGDTFVPYSSDEEVAVVEAALADLHGTKLAGVHAHYKAAVEALTSGDFAGSMRESHQAVESMTKLLTGEGTLQDGVKVLAKKGLLHVTVQQGIEKIAAWTNAVAGIRHANKPGEAEPAVTEDDAVFLLGVCGAAISYLKRRGEKARLIK